MARVPSVLTPAAERREREFIEHRRFVRELATLDPYSRQRVREEQHAAEQRVTRERRRRVRR